MRLWKLKECRKQAGLSGAELAGRIGVERETIWRYETGERSPESLWRIYELAEALGCRPGELFDGPVSLAARTALTVVDTIPEAQRENWFNVGRAMWVPLGQDQTQKRDTG